MIKTLKTRGFTLTELLTATFVMVLCLGLVVPMVHSTGSVWNHALADKGNKELLSQAILELSPTLRDTLLVDTANSTAHKLVVILPKVDPVSKNYLYPAQNGDSYAFYLADTTGVVGSNGTILWRSINGVPDATWSLISGKGVIDFGTSNLNFSFDAPADPNLVTLTVNSTQYTGDTPAAATATTTVQLRNHQISGL